MPAAGGAASVVEGPQHVRVVVRQTAASASDEPHHLGPRKRAIWPTSFSSHQDDPDGSCLACAACSRRHLRVLPPVADKASIPRRFPPRPARGVENRSTWNAIRPRAFRRTTRTHRHGLTGDEVRQDRVRREGINDDEIVTPRARRAARNRPSIFSIRTVAPGRASHRPGVMRVFSAIRMTARSTSKSIRTPLRNSVRQTRRRPGPTTPSRKRPAWDSVSGMRRSDRTDGSSRWAGPGTCRETRHAMRRAGTSARAGRRSNGRDLVHRKRSRSR